MSRFHDRRQAGQRLGKRLAAYAGKNTLVLGLPRGGVPVAYEVAKAIGARLDVWVVRKVGVPWQRELGIGAVAEGGFVHLNRDVVDAVGLSPDDVARAIDETRLEVAARVHRFRGDHSSPRLTGETVIVVDDGIATGGTMHAALLAVRAGGARHVVLAVPVAAYESVEQMRPLVDEVVCLLTPSEFHSVGAWYADFAQVSDEEVLALLKQAQAEREVSHVVR